MTTVPADPATSRAGGRSRGTNVRRGPGWPELDDPATVRREQIRRLQGMLEPVLRENAFYRAKLGRAGVRAPADVSSMEDYRQLPMTTKSELTQDQARNPPFGTFTTYPPERYIQEHHTSGTTGQTLRWLDTAESWAWLAKCWARVFRAVGVTAADRIFFPFSFGPYLGTWSGVAGARRVGSLILPAGGLSSLERVRAILEHRPTVLVCTPTYAFRLAEVAEDAGLDLAGSALRVNVHPGEPGAGIPSTRARLQEAFGAQVFDHAGSTEVGAWGFECEARDGLHLHEGEFIFEVLDPDTGAAAAEGELVITNLGRAGMPVIRYRTGDWGRLHPRPCACGSAFRRLDGGVRGRLDQRLTVQGVTFFPSVVENVIRRRREVREFAVDVRRRGNRDDIELRLELGSGDADRILSRVAADLREALGVRFDVRAVPVGTLPRFPVKARRFTDHQPPSAATSSRECPR